MSVGSEEHLRCAWRRRCSIGLGSVSPVMVLRCGTRRQGQVELTREVARRGATTEQSNGFLGDKHN